MSQQNSLQLSELFFAQCTQEIIEMEQIELLLTAGADINFQSSEDGYTALMVAVDSDNEPLVNFLLNKGANPLIKNNYGEIASDIALRYSPIYLLIKNYELLFASFINDIETAKLAIASGANIHFKGIQGYTALMIAKEQSHLSLIKYFEGHHNS